jgi:hypothetical protein
MPTLFFFLSLFLIGLTIVILNQDWRDDFRKWFRGSDRTILATLRGDFDGTGQLFSVFKIRESGALFVEFYSQKSVGDGLDSEVLAQSTIELIQRLELPNPIDGYVTFMGEATNLAVANLDGDPMLELLVPSYNLELAASLDVIKFNAALNKFELMSSFDVPENLIEGLQREGQ